jgi:hypothetical protein
VIAGAIGSDTAVAVIVGILGSGGIASLYAGRKVKPETEAIGIKSMGEVNAELRTEITRHIKLNEELRTQNDRQERVIREQDEALTRAEERIRVQIQEIGDLEARLDERGQ